MRRRRRARVTGHAQEPSAGDRIPRPPLSGVNADSILVNEQAFGVSGGGMWQPELDEVRLSTC